MSAASRSQFVCGGCGFRSPKWLGRCPECEAWDSFEEEPLARVGRAGPPAVAAPLARLDEEATERFSSSIAVLDRVLGGGVVPGGAVLLAGEPGIGKSTLLLQLAAGLARRGGRVLYASAEESPGQLRLRAQRLGCADSEILIAGENGLEPILAAAADGPFRAVLVDSIQAVRSGDLESPAGSVAQVRHAADRLVDLAKRERAALFLVGHVTKEGTIAGPKSLEHLVDTVLAFEGESGGEHRILRATKNRFGPTGEVAMFEMRDSGLEPVSDPSRLLLARRRAGAPGSAVAPSLQGTRPLLVEVQALVHRTNFPSPRRMAMGCDPNRVVLLIAVLERFAGLSFAERDVFLNVVGGLVLREPAADLSIVAALVSALGERPLPADAVFFGEVGLLGEVRGVSRVESRLREAAAHGFRRAYTPRTGPIGVPGEIKPIEIDSLGELLAALRTAGERR